MPRQVEELTYPSDYRKIMLFFRKNPYFRNEVVVKEYVIHVTGKRQLPGSWGRADGVR